MFVFDMLVVFATHFVIYRVVVRNCMSVRQRQQQSAMAIVDVDKYQAWLAVLPQLPMSNTQL